MSLTPSRRSELRAEAHKLGPVVIIGDKGLTDEVVTEIDRSLRAHELIKVRAASGDRKARGDWMKRICERLSAEPVQEIGKVLVIYRKTPEERPGPGLRRGDKRERSNEERMASAREKQKAKDEKKRREKEAEEVRLKRTARPRSRTPSPLPESAPPRRRPRTSR
ncbi:MAG TPA: YhbY family RNA-binding protein [Usitatibacter sp.]|nr:YhbY family RNA-binding protein [Usitatibacter sp.]